jgi:hypothetical protein
MSSGLFVILTTGWEHTNHKHISLYCVIMKKTVISQVEKFSTMKAYKLINNLGGWLIFLIAAVVYISTAEPTASFWDCGEYIATSYKLQVGHPPGAPTFQLIGRIFLAVRLRKH